MRVAFDARVLSKPLRGIGSYVVNLFKSMSLLAPNISFLGYMQAKPFRNLAYDFFKMYNFDFPGDRLRLWEQIALPFHLAKSGVSLFHATANTLPYWSRVPVVLTVHDVMFDNVRPDAYSDFYYDRIMPLAINRAGKIITISDYSKKQVIDKYKVSDNKISVIYNGVDPYFKVCTDKAYLRKWLIELGIDSEYMLFLAAPDPRKNTDTVLEAFSVFRAKHKNKLIKLLLVGVKDDFFERLKKKAMAFRCEDSVIFLPFVSPEELLILYNAATVFLYVSLSEGFGLPILEAMACGAPVITSKVTSMPEIAGNAAFLVDPLDKDSIVDAMLKLANDRSAREQLRRLGLERVKQFSWDVSAQKTLDIYSEILNN